MSDNTNHSWIDPIVPDEDDRCRYLRYKFVNGQLLRQLDVYIGTTLTTTYAFQEDEDTAPQVGDECLKIDYVIVSGVKQSITCTVVTVTQEILDDTIAQANLAPTDIAVSNAVIPETTGIGEVIGILSTFDPNTTDTHTYSIISDPDDKFQITGDSLRLKNLVDFDTSTSHTVTIRSIDQGLLSYDKQFTISVTQNIVFVNDKATLFQGDTFNQYMEGSQSSDVLSGNVSFTANLWAKANNPVFENEYSMSFDGVNERIDTTADYSNKTKLTISGWFYRSGSTRLDLSQTDNSNSQRIKLIRNLTGIYLVAGPGASINFNDTTVGQWQHLVAVYDGTQAVAANRGKLYLNGVQQTITGTAGTLPTSLGTITDNFKIGFDNGSTKYSTGKIDEVSVWNDALTSAEILEIYNSQTPTDLTSHSASADLINWWRMGDELTGSTVPDQVGSNDGTLVNMDSSNRSTALAGEGSSSFFPDDISDLHIWLDADDDTTLTESSGQVSQWDDKSGNGNNLTQTGTSRPTTTPNGYGSRTTIGFDGVDDYMTATISGVEDEFTIFIVSKFNQLNQGSSDFDYVYSYGSNSANQLISLARRSGGGTLPDDYYLYNGSTTLDGPDLVGQQFQIHTQRINNTATYHEYFIDGVSQTVVDNSTAFSINNTFDLGRYLAGSHYLDGEIAEVVIYNRSLNNTERQQVETYLDSKWEQGIDPAGYKTLLYLGRDIGEDRKVSIDWNEADKLRLKYYNTSSSQVETIEASGNFGNNTYRMFTVDYNLISQDLSLYVDGAVVGTASSTLLDAAGTDPILIATDADQSVFYDGLMDEVSIWNSQVDISEIYNGGFCSNLSLHSDSSNLEAWWRLGDPPDSFTTSNGILDASGNSNALTANNMTVTNCVSDSVPEVATYENSLSLPFNGIDQYGDTGITTDMTGSGDFSISVWYKGSSPSYIVSQAHTLGPYSSDFIIGGGGAIFWMRTQTVGNLSSINDNQWHHLVLSWDSGSSTYDGYLDGVNIGTSATVSGFGGTGPVSVSTRGDFTTSFNSGNLDELSVWDKALNDSEVTEIYNSGVPTDLSLSSPVGNLTNWYRFGEDSGDTETTVIDQLGNSDMTLSNFSSNPYDSDVPS